mmetsp:Transcript_63661/g.170576  ORF Transcript_63661/g.170576 Transcript_63661/m.170576 type:complete len:275 (+) Transcript_63661:264-1088(+)
MGQSRRGHRPRGVRAAIRWHQQRVLELRQCGNARCALRASVRLVHHHQRRRRAPPQQAGRTPRCAVGGGRPSPRGLCPPHSAGQLPRDPGRRRGFRVSGAHASLAGAVALADQRRCPADRGPQLLGLGSIGMRPAQLLRGLHRCPGCWLPMIHPRSRCRELVPVSFKRTQSIHTNTGIWRADLRQHPLFECTARVLAVRSCRRRRHRWRENRSRGSLVSPVRPAGRVRGPRRHRLNPRGRPGSHGGGLGRTPRLPILRRSGGSCAGAGVQRSAA